MTEYLASQIKLVYYSPDFFANLTDESPIPESRRDWVKPDTIRSLIYTRCVLCPVL